MIVSTWNMQGNAYNDTCSTFAEAKNRMLNENIDVFCLQECGNIKQIYKDMVPVISLDGYCVEKKTITIGTSDRGEIVNLYFLGFGWKNHRCSMAIMVKQKIDSNNPAIITPGGCLGIRPVFGILVEDNTAIYNIHGPSGVPNFSRSIAYDALDEILLLKNQYAIKNCILIGDFNCKPNDFDYGMLAQNGLNICIPTSGQVIVPTQNSGNCLDYGISTIPHQEVSINSNAAFCGISLLLFAVDR